MLLPIVKLEITDASKHPNSDQTSLRSMHKNAIGYKRQEEIHLLQLSDLSQTEKIPANVYLSRGFHVGVRVRGNVRSYFRWGRLAGIATRHGVGLLSLICDL